MEYERNKQYEKLVTETMAMMEKMESVRHKEWMITYNMGGVSLKAPTALLAKFKTFDAEKFDGTRDPKQHIRRYPKHC